MSGNYRNFWALLGDDALAEYDALDEGLTDPQGSAHD